MQREKEKKRKADAKRKRRLERKLQNLPESSTAAGSDESLIAETDQANPDDPSTDASADTTGTGNG